MLFLLNTKKSILAFFRKIRPVYLKTINKTLRTFEMLYFLWLFPIDAVLIYNEQEVPF